MIKKKLFGVGKQTISGIVDDESLILHLDFSNTSCFSNGNDYVTCLKSGVTGSFNTDYVFPTYVNDYGGGLNFSGPKSIGFGDPFGEFTTREVTFEAIAVYVYTIANQAVLSKRINLSPYTQYALMIGGPTSVNGTDWGRPAILLIDDAGYSNGHQYAYGPLLTNGTLYHVMATAKYNEPAKVFLNGVDVTQGVPVQDNTGTFTWPAHTCRLSVGAMTDENINDIGYQIADSPTGNIYQVRMYERRLSDIEVLQNYNVIRTKFGL